MGHTRNTTIASQILSQEPSDGNGRSLALIVGLAALLLAWLWPIGLGGRMPLGGDVTQFFLGLMHVYGQSLKAGRLPVWNDLWGYGFPGLGESQMGVYYPPHLVLYGLLGTEQAYVASLVVHTLWAGLGAWWAARQFGASAPGAGLAGWAYAASGFFVIHMPHPWGYTTGSWMPWALGLGWSILDETPFRRPRRHLLLSLVLFLQILPGHFQIAFMTQVSLLVLAIWSAFDRGGRGNAHPCRDTWLTILCLTGCVLVVFPLAGMQVWPTARLARLASAQRDFEYLSGFAATPIHLISLVAPGLFHRSPLWRPLVWDPFHTSPEEMLAYVGLAPFCLANLVVLKDVHRDRRVRALGVLALSSLLLSFGPYVPGFRLLISLPGFSFFRAPARWTLLLSLCLSILGGLGLDRCRGWPKPGRAILISVGAVALWMSLVVGLLELALASSLHGMAQVVAGGFELAFRARPWSGDPSFLAVLKEASRPPLDPRVPPQLFFPRIASPPRDLRTFRQRRIEIYGAELGQTAGLLGALAGLGILGLFPGGRRWIPEGLILLTVLDLGLLGRHRSVSLGPLRPLVEQSPVLAELARQPHGTRVADGFRNLSMLVGLEPISSYRTLDLPALESITRLTRGPLGDQLSNQLARQALRATGTGVRVLDPVEVALGRRDAPLLDDPVLARCLFGDSWNQEQPGWGSRFRIERLDGPAALAWFVPDHAVPDAAILDAWNGDPRSVLAVFDQARPLSVERSAPARTTVEVEVSEPGWVIVSQLADPQWRARWTGKELAGSLESAILPTFRRRRGDGGWQRVRVPSAGRWTLRLEYDAADVRQGLVVSAGAWIVWVGLLVLLEVRSGRRRKIG